MNRKQIMSDVMAMQMKNTENACNNDEKIGIETLVVTLTVILRLRYVNIRRVLRGT